MKYTNRMNLIAVLTLVLLFIALIVGYDLNRRSQFPDAPVIITVPTIPDTIRTDINKEINDEAFNRAFERFKTCMTDGNRISTKECRRRFYTHE
jgi:hypothetical protein